MFQRPVLVPRDSTAAAGIVQDALLYLTLPKVQDKVAGLLKQVLQANDRAKTTGVRLLDYSQEQQLNRLQEFVQSAGGAGFSAIALLHFLQQSPAAPVRIPLATLLLER